MLSEVKNGRIALSVDDKARAINLALFLELYDYDIILLKFVLSLFSKSERQAIYAFWAGLTPVTYKAFLCMKELEEKIFEF